TLPNLIVGYIFVRPFLQRYGERWNDFFTSVLSEKDTSLRRLRRFMNDQLRICPGSPHPKCLPGRYYSIRNVVGNTRTVPILVHAAPPIVPDSNHRAYSGFRPPQIPIYG